MCPIHLLLPAGTDTYRFPRSSSRERRPSTNAMATVRLQQAFRCNSSHTSHDHSFMMENAMATVRLQQAFRCNSSHTSHDHSFMMENTSSAASSMYPTCILSALFQQVNPVDGKGVRICKRWIMRLRRRLASNTKWSWRWGFPRKAA
jgi:hypothetical protein